MSLASSVPVSVRAGVEAALRNIGVSATIRAADPVGGGCIHRGHRIELTSGVSYFLKWNPTASPDMFEAEADGLDALRRAGPGLRIPQPLARAAADERVAWLLMEYVAAGVSSPRSEEALGRGLAALHAAASPHEGFGWHRDNWIGSLEQANEPTPSWAAFWRDRRLAPQIALARASGLLDQRAAHGGAGPFDRLLEALPSALEGVRPALLHGDLWGGNAYFDGEGIPVLIDPAVYRGDGEVDLAMTELFGGFGRAFYDAYAEVRPLTDEYADHRRDLYQLYYLLVHVNLFGRSYLSGTIAAAQRVVSALGV